MFPFNNKIDTNLTENFISRIENYNRKTKILDTSHARVISAEIFNQSDPDPIELDCIIIHFGSQPLVVWYNEYRLSSNNYFFVLTERERWWEMRNGWSLFIEVTDPMRLLVQNMDENIRKEIFIFKLKNEIATAFNYLKN